MNLHCAAVFAVLLWPGSSSNLEAQGFRGTIENIKELWEENLSPMQLESTLDFMTMGELVSSRRQTQIEDDLHLNLVYHNHPHETHAHRYLQQTSEASSAPAFAPSTNTTAIPRSTHIKPIRIVFETTELELNAGSNQNGILNVIKETVLPEISAAWSSILSVIPVVENIPIPTDVCNGLFPNVPPSVQQDADTVILVSGASVVNGKILCGAKTLASASFCNLDQIDRPVIGFINFCLENISTIDLDKIIKVGVHEVGHVLGWNDDLFKYFRDRGTGEPLTPRPFQSQSITCVDGSIREYELPAENTVVPKITEKKDRNHTSYEIVTPSVQRAVSNQFGCADLQGARLENQPTRNSCIGAHFDERFFFTEVMSPIYSSKYTSALSPLTVAVLEDSGFYDVDYSSRFVKNSPFGLGAGCDFVFGDCVDTSTNTVKNSFQSYFCDSITKFSEGGIDKGSETTCDPTFTSIAYCDLFDFTNGAPEGYALPSDQAIQHFNNPNLGVLFTHADYCPVPAIQKLDCTASNYDLQKFYPGEKFGRSSRCVNTEYRHPRDGVMKRGACFQTHCNTDNDTLEVYVDGEILICEEHGQVHDFPWTQTATFQCPPLLAVCPEMFCPGLCSSKGKCNYEANPPKCECFDNLDTSPGCFGRGYEPPVRSYYSEDNSVLENESSVAYAKSASLCIVFFVGNLFLI